MIGTEGTYFNPLKTDVYPHYVHNFGSSHKEDTVHVHYENQPVNASKGDIIVAIIENIYKYTVWQYAWFPNVAAGVTYSNCWALNG